MDLFDSNLANLYGVTISSFNQAVKRNNERFPADFMFQLKYQEVTILRSQNVILRRDHGKHRKYLPYAFTEQGVAMLSSVLRSKKAIRVNIEIMRTFFRMRKILNDHQVFRRELAKLERTVAGHDSQIKSLFEAIRQLIGSPNQNYKPIGFQIK